MFIVNFILHIATAFIVSITVLIVIAFLDVVTFSVVGMAIIIWADVAAFFITSVVVDIVYVALSVF